MRTDWSAATSAELRDAVSSPRVSAAEKAYVMAEVKRRVDTYSDARVVAAVKSVKRLARELKSEEPIKLAISMRVAEANWKSWSYEADRAIQTKRF